MEERQKIDLTRLSAAQRKEQELAPLVTGAPTTAQSRQIAQLVTQVFKKATTTKGPKGRRIIVSSYSQNYTPDLKQYALLKDSTRPNRIYVVERDNPDPTSSLLYIDTESWETFDHQSSAPYAVTDVIKLLRRLAPPLRQRGSLPQVRNSNRRRRWRRRLKIAGIATAVTGVMSGIVVAIALYEPEVIDPIKGERVYAADNSSQRIEWSDQYEGREEKLDRWYDSKGKEIPTKEPVKLAAPVGGFINPCSTFTADVRDGQRFRAVFQGQRGDGFVLKIEHQSNVIEICRTGSEGALSGGTNDIVYLQRLA